MPDRSEITLLLELPGTTPARSDTTEGSSKIDPERRKALAEHRERMFQEMAKHDRDVRRTKEKSDREMWLREMAQIMEVDVNMLLLEEHAGGSQSDSPEDEEDESIEEYHASVRLYPGLENRICDYVLTDRSAGRHLLRRIGICTMEHTYHIRHLHQLLSDPCTTSAKKRIARQCDLPIC